MMDKAVQDNMKAVAITDHGNMFGVFKFVAEANKRNIKPIVGCEFYVVADRHKKTFTKELSDHRYHQLFLAKNQEGYQNLAKLCSLGFIQGYYSKYPRIDKELVLQYHKGLIATTCCLGALVPQLILKESEEAAEKEFKWWLDLFGEDYYIEIQRHHLPEQEKVNEVLLRFAKKYNVKIIASNDSHYINQSDSDAHDILLCINTGEFLSTPKGDAKGQRFGFPNNEFYFKTTAEMTALFNDIPQAIDNTNEIYDKITPPHLKRDILLPHFPIPSPFENANDYLRHLTFEGARKRYKEITPEIEERLNFELKIIIQMGFSGYFLIVSDFIRKGKEIGVMIGPGRGSAAGSAVAYVIEITNIDPIKYNLLFERFLNPERVSMPDIDTDFDEDGRQKVIDYVVDKYGKNQVAQIITYGTMAAKSAIKDVARVMEYPIADSNALTKMIPDTPGISLDKAIEGSKELQAIIESNDMRARIINQAKVLEGSVRNSGIHASAVIIAPDDITNYIPVSVAKDSDLLVTQFDGKVIEEAGMLKMDFLGLTNLNNIQDALKLIKENHNVNIDIDTIPLDDELTFELFQRGETIAIFQFESPGMQKHLKDLKPTNIEDLIAMNALYRPGPMEYIPSFINRKHGREKIEYPHPLLEELLAPTNGIMVYQEQIMLTARIIGGYSLGGADLLRRAMGKKDKEKMAKERVKFVQGATDLHQIPEKLSNEIFDIMERFAEYGFNRSHAAAYSVLAYQTAYLKANYPAEYMAAVMSRKTSDVSTISFLTNECKRMGIDVLGPNVNESNKYFSVNVLGKIRFALSAIKGLGDAAVEAIVEERTNKGAFTSFFDMMKRVNLRTVNKKSLEALTLAGALDDFNNGHRAQYLFPGKDGSMFIESVAKWAASMIDKKAASVASLFGSAGADKTLRDPVFPECDRWNMLEQLRHEKEVTGFYLSGHPLDVFKIDIETFTNCTVENITQMKDKPVNSAGIITSVDVRLDKNGNKYARFALEDFSGSADMVVFNEDYLKYASYLEVGKMIFVKGNYEIRSKFKANYEYRIKSVQLLSSIRESEAKSIMLRMTMSQVNDQLIQRLHTICMAHPGKCYVKMSVLDEEENYFVTMKSLEFKVDSTNDLLAELAELDILSFKLGTS